MTAPPFALKASGWLANGTLPEARRADTLEALKNLQKEYARGEIAFLEAVESPPTLDRLRASADRIRDRARQVIVFGTGGSSLGGQALVALAPSNGNCPRVLFANSIDPGTSKSLFAGLKAAETSTIVVSKSGETVETCALAALALAWYEQASVPPGERVVFVVQPGKSSLRTLAESYAIETIDHDPEIGGRFSVFSATGLLPALVAGADADAALDGARTVLRTTMEADDVPPPAEGAAAAVEMMESADVKTLATVIYGDALHPLAMWHRQLWAESLGKDGHGSTPVVAQGTADQHSQLQLYLDGPPDKMFTLVSCDDDRGLRIPDNLPGIPSWLAGRALGDVFSAHAKATADALAASGRPVRTVTFGAPLMQSVGGFMMHLMIEVILAARLLRVDPYDQPAVESIKHRARTLLGGS